MDDEMGLTEFFGIKVPPNKEVEVGHTPGPTDDSLDTIHLSQVALGPKAKEGRHVVWVQFSGRKSVIGSLTLGGIEQFQIDFPVNRQLTISHSGPSDVYLTGYTTHQFLPLDSSFEDDSDDDGGPQHNGQLQQGSLHSDDEDSEEDSDFLSGEEDDETEDNSDENSEEDGGDEGLGLSKLGAQRARRMELESYEDGEASALQIADTPGGGISPHIDSDESDESTSEGEDEDEDEDGSDDGEGDDGLEDELLQLKAEGSKRKSAGAPAPAPVSQPKKAKTADQAQLAGKAVASTPASGSAGALADYEKTLGKYLKANGPTKMAVIGSQVKRAPGLPKLKKFVSDRPTLFQLDDVTGVLTVTK